MRLELEEIIMLCWMFGVKKTDMMGSIINM